MPCGTTAGNLLQAAWPNRNTEKDHKYIKREENQAYSLILIKFCTTYSKLIYGNVVSRLSFLY